MNMTTAYTIQAKVTGAQQIAGLTSGLQKVEGQSVRTEQVAQLAQFDHGQDYKQ